MIKHTFKILMLFFLAANSVYGELVPKYNSYTSLTYDSAKNAILGGATTATAKGYAALNSNPAGLSTNYNATLYFKTVAGTTYGTTDTASDVELASIDPGEQVSAGIMYDSFAVEYKVDNYIAAGGAYGLESVYGLFSLGISYTADQTDFNTIAMEESTIDKVQAATGDYLSYGFMWQKTFLDEEDFYALYFGYSYKNSGQADSRDGESTIITSPSRRKIGFGLETNMFDTSLLVTMDIINEFWQTASVEEDMSGIAYGVKWMIGHKFAIGGGLYTQTFSNSRLIDGETIGVGIEWGFLGMHIMPSYTMRTINYDMGSFDDEAFHLDVALTF